MKEIDFGELAETYDDFYKTALGQHIDKLEKAVVEELMQNIPAGKSLEIGCGTGHWTEYFAAKGNDIIAIDISREMVEIAERKNIPNTICLVHDVRNMPFKERFFENIFAITSLDFLDKEDKQKAFGEIKRVLKHYGYILVGGLNRKSSYIKALPKGNIILRGSLFSVQELREYLSLFGEPIIKGCIYWKDGEIIDEKLSESEKNIEEAAFIVGVVRYDRFLEEK